VKRFASALTIAAAAGCSSPVHIEPDEHLVQVPLGAPANEILRNLVLECGSADGSWTHDMGPGCTPVFAAQFALRAGLRRQRDDLIEIGRRTVRAQHSAINRLIIRAIFGGSGGDESSAYGFPALLLSAAIEGTRKHHRNFKLVLDRALQQDPGSLGTSETLGLAVTLAEYHRMLGDGDEDGTYLDAARRFTARVNEPSFRALALAAIARATRAEKDIAAAREAVEAACPPHDPAAGTFAFPEGEQHILSFHLALIGALADMAQLSGRPEDRRRAEDFLRYVFSDALFDGRFLMHDRFGGVRSKEFCSGCNFHALYLVDRLYGDAWRIAPVPEPPEREAAEEEAAPAVEDGAGVYGDTDQVRIWTTEASPASVGGGGPLRLDYTFEILPPDAEYPHGSLWFGFYLEHRIGDRTLAVDRRGDRAIIRALDEKRVASFGLSGFAREAAPEGFPAFRYDVRLVEIATDKVGDATVRRARIRLSVSRDKE